MEAVRLMSSFIAEGSDKTIVEHRIGFWTISRAEKGCKKRLYFQGILFLRTPHGGGGEERCHWGIGHTSAFCTPGASITYGVYVPGDKFVIKEEGIHICPVLERKRFKISEVLFV